MTVVTDNAAIQFKNVNYSAGGTHILKDITGVFVKGKITTLVGPSGAGKTTLFKLCNGLIPPDSGEIYLHDKHIDSYDPVKLRLGVGLALQDATMIRGSVRNNLALPMELQGKQLAEEHANELMEVVDLDKQLLDQDAKEISGGQRQRLSIARTLVNNPEILLLDEITSSLDRVSKKDVENLIMKINRDYGTTIIWITHSIHQARTIGDYTWVMMDGSLMESGESGLLDNPENNAVNQFVKGEVE